jgi:hypothetical protein
MVADIYADESVDPDRLVSEMRLSISLQNCSI